MNSTKGYRAFCAFAEGKSFSLIGLGVSNVPLVSFLLESGAAKVTVRDLKKSNDDQAVIQALRDGAEVILGSEYLSRLDEDVILRSPGIRPDIEPFIQARTHGSEITCETELFLRFAPCKTYAITGSDGKTTTTTLIAKILEASGKTVYLGGNIGRAMLPALKEMEGKDWVSVSELSSFQLMDSAYSPNVAVITNLSENHLDWHKDMEEYLDAKKCILKWQEKDSVAVLNFDNSFTKACKSQGAIRYFSSVQKADSPCVYIKDGAIVYYDGQNEKEFLKTSQILLPGKHNVENYMAAIAATMDDAEITAIQEVAETFGGVEHRIEFIRELNGVKYYNSSIDSSPARSTAALKAFDKKLIMIAGGYDKNLDYTLLGSVICEKVRVLILCGATSEKIKKAVMQCDAYRPGAPEIICADSFDVTAQLGQNAARSGECVILSPASASFDMFKNFEERGRLFKKLVNDLK